MQNVRIRIKNVKIIFKNTLKYISLMEFIYIYDHLIMYFYFIKLRVKLKLIKIFYNN